MKKDINYSLGAFRLGAKPQLSLPASFHQPSKLSDETMNPSSPTRPSSPNNNSWWTENPSVRQDWKLPDGKQYRNVFSPEDLRDWPKVPHHSSGKPRPICIKYQTLGKCRAKCHNSHAKPSTIDRNMADDVTSRLQEIFQRS